MNIPGGYATHGTTFDDATGMNPGNLGYADFVYRNDQPPTTAWYHDHALGMTRNNVYAGPAGFWLIRNGPNDGVTGGTLPYPAPASPEGVLDVNLPESLGGHRGMYREIPIVIQDRSFKQDGSLFYPRTRAYFEDLPHNLLNIPFIPNANSDISPIWNPEAFFNTMVVNGVAWPVHEVAPALYRLRFLNGCNSRFLWLKFDNPDVKVYQIGAEQGFLPTPVDMNALNLDGGIDDGTAQILMALAERADVIVDFRGLADGDVVNLLNIGPDEPFGGGLPGVDFTPADPDTTGRVMKFRVNSALLGLSNSDPGGAGPNATDPSLSLLELNAELPLPATSDVTRQVTLNEAVSEKICVNVTEDDAGNVVEVRRIARVHPGPDFETRCGDAGGEPFGPREALLGVLKDATAGNFGYPVPLMWTDTTGTSTPVPVTLRKDTDGETVIMVPVTENPTVGDQETWEIFNVTADAHPMHLHLVRFQVINRGGLFLSDPEDPESVVFPIQLDDHVPRGPEPWEMGYKDTVIAYPGEVTRIKAVFDIAGLYVWHCHIVEHEDNEMMRPFVVSPPPPPPEPE
jgi:FtsP/CotA-like multicopper oxidase with cupredoxin domain